MVYVIILAAVVSVVLALLLWGASVALHVEEDPRLQGIVDLLPNQNCGLCGNPGCKAMAQAILNEDSKLSQCKPGTAEMREDIAEFLETYDNDANGVDAIKVKM
ncbi:Electron transport complex protein rnfB [Candidatus Izimaplasma bacterium HR1]|jgi:electron transport complex protein RnfB|uniref:(Fe-S)-binding protein n=1 Tax=Candidatus Izimoplasma sp. HR1 TaxID=1541959 RepID=UPI0004F5C16F|nr:Electron transport complex protein rnfB [Candidatus Izimaplasma bacterium HR1]